MVLNTDVLNTLLQLARLGYVIYQVLKSISSSLWLLQILRYTTCKKQRSKNNFVKT